MEGRWKRKTSASLGWPLAKSLKLSEELSLFDVMYEMPWRSENEAKFSISQNSFALCHLKLVKGLASRPFQSYTFIWWFGTHFPFPVAAGGWLHGVTFTRPFSSKREGKRKEGFNFHSSMVRSNFFPPRYSVFAFVKTLLGRKKKESERNKMY